MNKLTLITSFITMLFGVAIGYFLLNSDIVMQEEIKSPEKEIAYWVAPMDPNYRRDKPGKSPMGMDLVPVYTGDDTAQNDVGFKVSSNVLANLGVKTEAAEISPFAVIVEATGRVQYDETKTERVQVRSEGWVEELLMRAVGDKIKKGDLLFTLYSPAIASALAEYGQALSSGSKRLQSLTLGKLQALGIQERTINEVRKSGKWSAPIGFYAPLSGVVTKLGVRQGSLSAKNTIAFEITDPSTMWLIAEVFESQAKEVAVGQVATIIAEGAEIEAVVDYIYPELDAKLQTARVRINVANENATIRAGQYFEVNILPQAFDQLTVPTSAVIRLGSGDRVILAHGGGKFEAAEVVIGASSGGRTVIRRGLSAGEEVVISGQFMLDSESSFTGAALRMADREKSHAMEDMQ